MKIVLDTNIYLAASAKNSEVCRSLFINLITNNAYQLYISPDILLELHKKASLLINEGLLNIKAFKKLVLLIYRKIHFITPKINLADLNVVRDLNDNKILECALACKANLIISMDKDLLKLKNYETTGIIHPMTLTYIIGSHELF